MTITDLANARNHCMFKMEMIAKQAEKSKGAGIVTGPNSPTTEQQRLYQEGNDWLRRLREIDAEIEKQIIAAFP